MSITTPGERVEAPACVPPRFDLLSVAEVDDRADGHWGLGFHHEQITCEEIQSRALKCVEPTEKVTDETLSYPESDPFTVIAPFKCATSRMTLARAWELADERLKRAEGRAVEKAFWSGRDSLGNLIRQSLGGNPDVVDLTPVDGAVDVSSGLMMLESWAGEMMPCGPIIHAQRGLGVYLAERGLTESSGQLMYSKGTGSRISLGGGYQATGPGVVPVDPEDPLGPPVAAVDGETWMFVTGSIKVIRGPVFHTPEAGDLAGAVDRLVNDVEVFSERNYGFEYDCGVAAVRVRLNSCCGCSGGGAGGDDVDGGGP